ncbi:MAG: hypothetical protein QXG00_03940 [Candidatus Woesearchaeota archaeon]
MVSYESATRLKDKIIMGMGILLTGAIIYTMQIYSILNNKPKPVYGHRIDQTVMQASHMITKQEYEQHKLKIIVGTSSMDIPYNSLSSAIIKTHNIPCVCEGAPGGIVNIPIKGLDLDGVLLRYILEAKEAGYNRIKLEASDGIYVAIPISGDIISSHSMKNMKPKNDTPHEVIAFIPDSKITTAYHLDKFEKIEFDKGTEFGMFSKGEFTDYKLNNISDIITKKRFAKSDSFKVPLEELINDFNTEKGLLLVSADGYKVIIPQNQLNYALVEFINGQYSITSDKDDKGNDLIGKRFKVKDLIQIGFASPNL